MSMRDSLSWSRELIGAPIDPAIVEDTMKLESWHSADDKAKWKVVRTDDYTDVEGEIITADEDTGEVCLTVAGERKTLPFGPQGIRIVGRR